MTPPLTVFYSWQRDLPDETNKGLISDALEKACEALSLELDVPVRSDSDTQGHSGAPDIAATILRKIEQAAVFVADVSIIGKIAAGAKGEQRSTPNPNVMLELGYAKKALGPERVIMICNAAYCRIEDLPFDIRGRAVTQYKYDGANEEKSADACKELVAKLKESLGAALRVVAAQRAAQASVRAAETVQEMLGRRKGLFETWRTARIAEILSDPPIPLVDGPLMVLHVVPTQSMDPDFEIDLYSKRDLVLNELSPVTYGGWSWFPDEDSVVTASAGSRDDRVMTYKRLFRNGALQLVRAMRSENVNAVASGAVRALEGLAPAPGKLGLGAECFVALDLVRVKGCEIKPDGMLSYDPSVHPKKFGKDLHPPSIVTADLRAQDAGRLLKPALDRIWAAAGFESCFYLTADGQWARM